MKDISAKIDTHRVATAETCVTMPADIQTILRERRLDKGDALEIARMAGIMAAKRTHDLIPFCHSIPIAQAEVRWGFEPDRVLITCVVRTNSSTGVEMEAMTGASLAALTLYDMLKPHTTELEIGSIRLTGKTGGKSDFAINLKPAATVAVVSLTGTKTSAAQSVVDALANEPNATVSERLDIANADLLRTELKRLVDAKTNVILTVGGTGLGPDDYAIETVQPLIERELPGVMEAARAYGQRRTPYSMLSRGVAGMIGDTVLVTLPGSTRGAEESYRALFPGLLHIIAGQRRSTVLG